MSTGHLEVTRRRSDSRHKRPFGVASHSALSQVVGDRMTTQSGMRRRHDFRQFVRELPPIDRWSWTKSFEAMVTGMPMVDRRPPAAAQPSRLARAKNAQPMVKARVSATNRTDAKG